MSTYAKMNPEYPIYIVSKGRWKSRLTSKALEKIGMPYSIAVEPQERDQYAAVIDPARILVLPFSDLGMGSIPARNWVWEHSIGEGFARHWVLDDNIRCFYRLNKNTKYLVQTGTIFKAAEDFVERFENVALAGFQYDFFAQWFQSFNPFILNTRIYSCILVKNDIPHRWRGRFNEDTDLSLRVLKDGWCTILFMAFLAGKVATMTMGGGNTDELYQGDGRLEMARSLRRQHPDVVRIDQKYGRWQHVVDYKPFKRNALIPKKGVEVPMGVDNYEMELVDAKGDDD